MTIRKYQVPPHKIQSLGRTGSRNSCTPTEAVLTYEMSRSHSGDYKQYSFIEVTPYTVTEIY
jgi:hypothetical protein